MKAYDLIAEWYAKPQQGVASNVRQITIGQLDLLHDLIGQGDEALALRPGIGRSFVWAPRGRTKYVVTEGPGGRRNTIARMMNLVASGEGRLF